MAETMKMEGMRELRANMSQLQTVFTRDVQRKVLEKHAQPIADRARQLVPHDTGELRDSIAVSGRLSKRQYGLHKKVHPDDVEVFAGAGALPQAHLQEFGTQRIPARPYMRPSWDAVRAAMPEGIAKDLWGYLAEKFK